MQVVYLRGDPRKLKYRSGESKTEKGKEPTKHASTELGATGL